MEHGTHTRYSKGCRCDECRNAHRIYERDASRRRRRVQYGIEQPSTRLVNADEARKHIIFLTSKGIGLGAIANQVGTYRSTIQYIKKGKHENISNSLSKKILSVPSIPREPMAYTDASPVLKLLDELNKKGVTKTQVGKALGYEDGRLIIKNKMRVWRYHKVEAVCKEMLRLRP